MSSAKRRPFCLGLNVLISRTEVYQHVWWAANKVTIITKDYYEGINDINTLDKIWSASLFDFMGHQPFLFVIFIPIDMILKKLCGQMSSQFA